LVGRKKEHPACKKLSDEVLVCFIKIQIGLTFLIQVVLEKGR